MEKTYSFIIPHRNCPNLLGRLIDSIPARNDVEIIVVDDNSDDQKKPNNLRDDIILINIEANDSKGAGHARNVGLKRARGKWLLFADSDDYYEKGVLDVLDKYKDSLLDILYFNAYNESINNDLSNILQRYESSSKSKHDKCLLGLSCNAPWNKMYSNNFVSKVGETFEEIPVSNDAWFTNIMSVRAEAVKVDMTILYRYVNNPVGLTRHRHPIIDRYKEMESLRRRNRLKYEYHCIDLIVCSFDFSRYIKDYGILPALKYRIIQLCTDKYLRRAIVHKFFRWLFSLALVG